MSSQEDQHGCSVTFQLRRPDGKDHDIVDVFVNGAKAASLYPYKNGFRVLSQHLPNDPGDAVTITKFYPPAINIAIPTGG